MLSALPVKLVSCVFEMINKWELAPPYSGLLMFYVYFYYELFYTFNTIFVLSVTETEFSKQECVKYTLFTK